MHHGTCKVQKVEHASWVSLNAISNTECDCICQIWIKTLTDMRHSKYLKIQKNRFASSVLLNVIFNAECNGAGYEISIKTMII